MAAGTTSLISIDRSGSTSGNDSSTNPVLSADGTHIAFESLARKLVVGRELSVSGNVFVRDLVTGTTSLVSQDGTGGEMVDNWAEDPAISPDGGLVAFTTSANNLGPLDDDRDRDVYVRDLAAGMNHRVSTNAVFDADLAVFSPDGSMIAYTSGLAFLDRATDGSLTVVNSAETDTPVPPPDHPAFSPDGHRLAFVTSESLVSRDTRGLTGDVYVVDIGSNRFELVSANETQSAGGDDESSRFRAPVFSPDGRAIAYDSLASDLDRPDTNGQSGGGQISTMHDVFVARFVEFETTDVAVRMTTDAASIGRSGVATFHIVASNNGSASAENVAVSHLLPRNMAVVNISTSAGTCSDPIGPTGEWVLVTCRLGSLGPGEAGAVTFEATIGDAAGTRLLSGALVGHAPTLDAEQANNAASVEWTVMQ